MMFDSFERTIAARTIWGEARGEGDAGMRAVAHVLLNRLRDGRWGAAMGEVCLAPWQFSCWNLDDKANRPGMIRFAPMALELQDAGRAFADAIDAAARDDDPTAGATHYHADGIAVPPWARPPAVQTAHIGRHIFFRNVP